MARKRKNFSIDLKTFCRISILNWREDSIQHYNGKCAISGEKFNVVHHLYPFHKIIEETLSLLNLEQKESIEYYTEDQLNLIREMCRELHYKYGLGVCLSHQVHNEFHGLFGFDATRDDFYNYKYYKENDLDLSEIAKYDISRVANLQQSIKIYKSELFEILQASELETVRKILFGMLIYKKLYSLRNKDFYMTYKDMSFFCGKSRQRLINSVKSLEEGGFITVYRNKSKQLKLSDKQFKNIPNRYELNLLNNITTYSESQFISIEKNNITEHTYESVIKTLYTKKDLKKLCSRRQYQKLFSPTHMAL